MRHHPSCWNKVLAKLGFRRVPRRYKRQAAFAGRLSRIESLEARQMMTVTVNTLADVVNSSDAYMSLREALLEPDPVVDFHTSLSGGRIALSQGQLNINKAITITGPGADKLTIDAGGLSRVFSVGTGVGATISGLKITGGGNVTEGGGVLNFGDLTLQGVVVAGNTSTSLGGGVLSRNDASGNIASLHVLDSTIDGNSAVGGAGIMVGAVGGVVEIVGSTISNNRGLGLENSVYSAGGGLSVAGSATGSVAIINSTFSGNAALYSGGIRFHNNLAPATITNTTIVHNSGGGVDRLSTSSQVTFHNTIVADNLDNASVPRDINGAVASASSYNLIGSGDGSGLTHNVNGNKVGATGAPIDPLLAPLDNHGGRTKTHVPLPGSPALDAGNNTRASDAGITIDQRGRNRFVDLSGTASGIIDIGAYESGLIVSTALDELDSDYTHGDLSLREALALAAILPGKNEIEFDSSLLDTAIALTLGQLDIASDVDIIGLGARRQSIDALGNSRVFAIASESTVDISNITITGGGNVSAGAGIHSLGNLTLTAVDIVDNKTVLSSSSSGGGVYSLGSLKIVNSTIDGNQARYGGGLSVSLNTDSTLEIIGSTISRNVGLHEPASGEPNGYGGGLLLNAFAAATVRATIVNRRTC